MSLESFRTAPEIASLEGQSRRRGEEPSLPRYGAPAGEVREIIREFLTHELERLCTSDQIEALVVKFPDECMFANNDMEWRELESLYGERLASTIWCKLHPGFNVFGRGCAVIVQLVVFLSAVASIILSNIPGLASHWIRATAPAV